MRRLNLNTDGFNAAWDGPAFTQIEKYIEAWDQLAPDLKELKRGPMAAQVAQETEAASS
jgi:hypothetical protein